MSADRLLNALKYHSSGMDGAAGRPRMALVDSYNPSTGTARVRLQPEDVLTGWLPVITPWVGNGWGAHAPLSGGEQVLVVPVEDDAESGVVVGRAWSDAMRPPQSTPAGEIWFQHQAGAFIKVMNGGAILAQDQHGAFAFVHDGEVQLRDQSGATATLVNGKIILKDQSGATLTLNNDGTIYSSAPMVVGGNLTVLGAIDATGDVVAGKVSLENHFHDDPDTATPHPTTPPVV